MKKPEEYSFCEMKYPVGSAVTVKLWDGSRLQGTVEAIHCTLVTERLTVKFTDIRPDQVSAIVARDDDDAKEQLVPPY